MQARPLNAFNPYLYGPVAAILAIKDHIVK